ncbi:MAG: cyclic nucleotide-binding domain-containing protein, partial [Hyphomicrobiales bacterium]
MSQTTESASSLFATLDDWSSADLVTGILEGQYSAISAVQAATPALAEAIDRGAERLARGGRLVYLGAGTSGRIATQDGAELPPTFNWPYERAITLMAGGQGAVFHAVEGAEDKDIYIVQRGSMIVEKTIGKHPVFLSYLPAGSYFGEMAVLGGGKRTASVKAAIKSRVIRFPGE